MFRLARGIVGNHRPELWASLLVRQADFSQALITEEILNFPSLSALEREICQDQKTAIRWRCRKWNTAADQTRAAVHEMYGTSPGEASFANNCLLARRLVERGVRFVQLYHRGWDRHGAGGNEDIVNKLAALCRETDRAAAALVTDLKQRGLLDSTIEVWGGEFGPTPMNEARNGSRFMGRDHHARAFSMWLAGGGIKPGVTMCRTDDVGYSIVEDHVSVHDLHATILNRIRLDHTRLLHRFQGRDFRLTDVEGEVVQKLLG